MEPDPWVRVRQQWPFLPGAAIFYGRRRGEAASLTQIDHPLQMDCRASACFPTRGRQLRELWKPASADAAMAAARGTAYQSVDA